MTFTLCPAFGLCWIWTPEGNSGLSPGGRRSSHLLKVPLLRQGLPLPSPGSVRVVTGPDEWAVMQAAGVCMYKSVF